MMMEALFSSVANQLSISEEEIENVLVKINEAKLTVGTLSDGSVDHTTLSQCGIQKIEDAELILRAAKNFPHRLCPERLISTDGGMLRQPLLATRQHSDSFDGLTGSEPLDIRSLSILLATVYSWETLGIKLGLQMHQLEKIRHDCQGDLEMCKNRLFDYWLRQNVNPTWREVVEALEQMEENNLADKIRRLYWQHFTDSFGVRYSPVRQFSSDSPANSRKFISHGGSIETEHGIAPARMVPVSSSTLPAKVMSPFVTAASTSTALSSVTSVISTDMHIHPQPPLMSSAIASSTTSADVHAPLPTVTDTSQDDLQNLLKSMTIEDPQQIEITCKVYNADTNKLIESTPAPLTRDIKIKSRRRVQEFASNTVPVGTSIRLEVTTNHECYLYIINIGTSGKTSILLPNEYDPTNHFRPNETYYLPGPDFGFDIEGPPGRETLQILAYSEKQEKLEKFANRPVEENELYRDIVFRRKKTTNKKGFANIQFDVQ